MEEHNNKLGADCTCDSCTLQGTEAQLRSANDAAKALRAEVERLKGKYESCESCESCDGATDAGVFCVPCWNRVNLQVSDLTISERGWKATAEDAERQNGELKKRVELAIVGLGLLEESCPCGARPESPNTHPHVTGCLVEVTLRKVRGPVVEKPKSERCCYQSPEAAAAGLPGCGHCVVCVAQKREEGS